MIRAKYVSGLTAALETLHRWRDYQNGTRSPRNRPNKGSPLASARPRAETPETPSVIGYRPDIDGLRAIAVLSVFLFHANLKRFSGGFVGVDIFFVISGWLITSQISRAVASGTFTLREFYKRRILRIFPALFVMMLIVLAWGTIRFYPDELKDLSKSILAAAFSFSNLFFFNSVGYFDTAAEAKPLLHTWSLGVEEQFYILFPFVVAMIVRYSPARRDALLVALLLLSLAVSIVLSHTDPSAAYYLPQSRAWELLLGSLLAIEVIPRPGSRAGSEALAAAGLLAIAVAVLGYDQTTRFPGIPALLPCLGACAVILAGARSGPNRVGRLLSLRPIVFVGLISYSLYLWHVPLIVMQRAGHFIQTDFSRTADKVIAVGIAFPLAALSWWLVERPFRRDTLGLSRGTRARLALLGMGMVCCLCVATLVLDGLPRRFSQQATRLASYLSYDPAPAFRFGRCFLSNQYRFEAFDRQGCMQTDPRKGSYMLIGDSHAAHLYSGLANIYGARHNILQATATGCKPVLRDRAGDTSCARMNRYVFDEFLPTHPVDLLVISARWNPEDLAPLEQTLDWARSRQIQVVVVGPTVEFDVRLPRLLGDAANSGNWADLRKHVRSEYAELNRRMRSEILTSGSGYIDAYTLLCPRDCIYLAGGEPIMFDLGHFTRAGSDLMARRLLDSGVLKF